MTANFSVPEAVADALRGEAQRRLVRPGEVLTDFMRHCWPTYLAECVADDLQPVLDVEALDAETPPDQPAAPHEHSSTNADAMLPLARPDAEACGDTAT